MEDIQESLNSPVAPGTEPVQEIKDVGGGRLIASVKDSDENIIGLIQDS